MEYDRARLQIKINQEKEQNPEKSPNVELLLSSPHGVIGGIAGINVCIYLVVHWKEHWARNQKA